MEKLHQEDLDAGPARMEVEEAAGTMEVEGQAEAEEQARGSKRRKVDAVKHIPVSEAQPRPT